MKNITRKIIIGILAGIVSGLFSTGGGMIVVPALIYLLNMEDKKEELHKDDAVLFDEEENIKF